MSTLTSLAIRDLEVAMMRARTAEMDTPTAVSRTVPVDRTGNRAQEIVKGLVGTRRRVMKTFDELEDLRGYDGSYSIGDDFTVADATINMLTGEVELKTDADNESSWLNLEDTMRLDKTPAFKLASEVMRWKDLRHVVSVGDRITCIQSIAGEAYFDENSSHEVVESFGGVGVRDSQGDVMPFTAQRMPCLFAKIVTEEMELSTPTLPEPVATIELVEAEFNFDNEDRAEFKDLPRPTQMRLLEVFLDDADRLETWCDWEEEWEEHYGSISKDGVYRTVSKDVVRERRIKEAEDNLEWTERMRKGWTQKGLSRAFEDLNEEQQGKLLLAHRNGETIQVYIPTFEAFRDIATPHFQARCTYRVRPSMLDHWDERVKEAEAKLAEAKAS